MSEGPSLPQYHPNYGKYSGEGVSSKPNLLHVIEQVVQGKKLEDKNCTY